MIKTVGQILGVAVVSPTLLSSLGCANPQANVSASETTLIPKSTTTGVTVDPNDPDIEAGAAEVPGEQGTIGAYQARPSSEGPVAATLLIHENRGLTEHIRDVARRFAKVGYAGLAVDLLSRVGGSDQFANEAEATTAISQLDQEGVISDLRSGVMWLENQSYIQDGRVGAIG
jgi:carboxymethylenebutenolidase